MRKCFHDLDEYGSLGYFSAGLAVLGNLVSSKYTAIRGNVIPKLRTRRTLLG